MLLALKKYDLVCSVPLKCASSTIRHFFYEIEFGKPYLRDQGANSDYSSPYDYYSKQQIKRMSAFNVIKIYKNSKSIKYIVNFLLPKYFSQRGYQVLKYIQLKRDQAKYKNYHKIAIVRDPVSRLMSCYKSKVVFNRFLEKDDAPKILASQNLSIEPSFSEFVIHLDAYRLASPTIWFHTETLRQQIGNNPSWYDQIFDISEMDAFYDSVYKHTNTNARVVWRNDSSKKPLKHNDHQKTVMSATPEDIALIKQKYASDYELYGSYFNASPAADTPQLDKTLNTNPSTSS